MMLSYFKQYSENRFLFSNVIKEIAKIWKELKKIR